MKHILFFLLLALLTTQTSHTQYSEIPLPFPDTTRFKVQFVDEMHGWVSSYRGSILQTTDGGQTWKGHKFTADTVFNDIEFVDQQNGWLWVRDCLYINEACYQNKIYRTTDGGETWERRPFPDSTYVKRMSTPGSPNTFNFRHHTMFFLTKDRIVFEGVRFMTDSIGRFTPYYGWYSTTNAGIAWDSLPTIRSREFGGFLEMLVVKDTMNWMEIYYQLPTDIPSITRCFLSSDAGHSWTETKLWFDVKTRLVWKTNKNKFVIINVRKKTDGTYDNPAFITTDGGNTWFDSKYYGVAKIAIMPQDTTLWVIHDSNNHDYSDEGELRRVRRTGPKFPEEGKLMLPYLTRWITNVDNKVYALSANGRLFVFDDLLVGVDNLSTPEKSLPVIQSIHPNPFSESTQITYYIDTGMNVRISLYDGLGRFIKEIMPQTFQSRNSYSISLADHNLSAGLYFILIRADNQTIVKPIYRMK